MSNVKQHINNSLIDFRKALVESRAKINKIHDPHTKTLKQQSIADSNYSTSN